MKKQIFFDSRESIRANHLDSHCESLGHQQSPKLRFRSIPRIRGPIFLELFSWAETKGFLAWVVFAKACESYCCPGGRGFGSGFPVESEGKGGREWGGGLGVGWGQAKEPASQLARFCQKNSFSKLPFIGWSRMSGRTTSGTFRPSLGAQVLAVFSSEGREWGVGRILVGSAFGAPQIFTPNRSETLSNEGFGASGLKIGALQKRRFNDHGSNAPFSALLISFISQEKSQFQNCLGKRLEVPHILIPDVRGLLTLA